MLNHSYRIKLLTLIEEIDCKIHFELMKCNSTFSRARKVFNSDLWSISKVMFISPNKIIEKYIATNMYAFIHQVIIIAFLHNNMLI